MNVTNCHIRSFVCSDKLKTQVLLNAYLIVDSECKNSKNLAQNLHIIPENNENKHEQWRLNILLIKNLDINCNNNQKKTLSINYCGTAHSGKQKKIIK